MDTMAPLTYYSGPYMVGTREKGKEKTPFADADGSYQTLG